jgi:hypothetical protein
MAGCASLIRATLRAASLDNAYRTVRIGAISGRAAGSGSPPRHQLCRYLPRNSAKIGHFDPDQCFGPILGVELSPSG